MKRIIYLIFSFIFIGVNTDNVIAQYETYNIDYRTTKVGVFNPQWETEHTLNPTKYEHLTGYYRQELARIITEGVKNQKVKIYDKRKKEISIDSVINSVIKFEQKNFNRTLIKDSVWDYMVKYIGAYDFEEAITYHFDNLLIEKKTICYCPYIVRYKNFKSANLDSVQLPLFWIFPKDTMIIKKDKHSATTLPERCFYMPDTVLSVLPLVYPFKMPFTRNMFDFVQNKKIKVFQPEGKEFKTYKEIDDLFLIKGTAMYYDEDTGKDSIINTYSDILPEDVNTIRIGENWAIREDNLDIKKKVMYFLPLYNYDERYKQIGFRINHPQFNK